MSPWRARTRPRSCVVGARVGRLVAGDDLDLAAAQAGRDLQRVERRSRRLARPAASRRSRTPGCRTAAACACSVASPRPASAARKASVSHAPPPTSAAARAAGPGSTTTVGPSRPLGRRHDQARARCPPARAPSRPPGRAPACGWPRRIASGSRSRPALAAAARGSRAIRSSSASSRTISRPANSADHLGGQVVRGRPEAAAGDTRSTPSPRRSAARARMSSGRSPTTTMWASSTPSSRSRSDSHGPLRSRDPARSAPRCR